MLLWQKLQQQLISQSVLVLDLDFNATLLCNQLHWFEVQCSYLLANGTVKHILICGYSGFASLLVTLCFSSSKWKQLLCATERLTWLVVFSFGDEKYGQGRKAAWPVTTCPGIITFCSTVGLPFFCLFENGMAKNMKCKEFKGFLYVIDKMVTLSSYFVWRFLIKSKMSCLYRYVTQDKISLS